MVGCCNRSLRTMPSGKTDCALHAGTDGFGVEMTTDDAGLGWTTGELEEEKRIAADCRAVGVVVDGVTNNARELASGVAEEDVGGVWDKGDVEEAAAVVDGVWLEEEEIM